MWLSFFRKLLNKFLSIPRALRSKRKTVWSVAHSLRVYSNTPFPKYDLLWVNWVMLLRRWLMLATTKWILVNRWIIWWTIEVTITMKLMLYIHWLCTIQIYTVCVCVWNTTRNMNQRSDCVNACSTVSNILKYFELFIRLISAHIDESTQIQQIAFGSSFGRQTRITENVAKVQRSI